jgi:murein DD-endopeptidase MepM/ murein hydrolase activator NlpD
VSIRQRWALLVSNFPRRWAGLLVLGVVGALVLSRALLLVACARWGSWPVALEVPVQGLDRDRVVSTWLAPRSGGREHQGVDLFAKSGTPVLSATRGVIWKVGEDPLGGHVVTVLGEGPAFYYYAHLDRFADGLQPGLEVQPGTALGTVGNSGNARTTPSHLHFGVYRIGTFRTRAIDPAPLLRRVARRP